jgi:sec-independent protein translocase protein TatA
MFGYNFTTLIIILVIALLLFGPKRLPELGDSIGKAIRGFKKATEGEPEPLPPSAATPPPQGAGTNPTPEAKVCKNCQKPLGGDFAFCPHCGQKIS